MGQDRRGDRRAAWNLVSAEYTDACSGPEYKATGSHIRVEQAYLSEARAPALTGYRVLDHGGLSDFPEQSGKPLSDHKAIIVDLDLRRIDGYTGNVASHTRAGLFSRTGPRTIALTIGRPSATGPGRRAAHLRELSLGAAQADLKPFHFAEPAFTFVLHDAGDACSARMVAECVDAWCGSCPGARGLRWHGVGSECSALELGGATVGWLQDRSPCRGHMLTARIGIVGAKGLRFLPGEEVTGEEGCAWTTLADRRGR